MCSLQTERDTEAEGVFIAGYIMIYKSIRYFRMSTSQEFSKFNLMVKTRVAFLSDSKCLNKIFLACQKGQKRNGRWRTSKPLDILTRWQMNVKNAPTMVYCITPVKQGER